MGFLVLGGGFLGSNPSAEAEEGKIRVRVEIFLARGQKGDAEKIREEFKAIGVSNVHFQFFRAGHPPENVAIGRNVPLHVAQKAIELAIEYNRGIKFILPQALLPGTWVGIGTSAFDEQNQIPIAGDALESLRSPDLTQEQFHSLYQETAREPSLY